MMGMQGMVVSPHPLASEAGRKVVANGGDAISAAIAINAVLAVVCPHFCGLGGDAVWVVSDRDGQSKCLLGIGQGLTEPLIQGRIIPVRGTGSILTTAAVVNSWAAAQNYASTIWNDRRSLSELLLPAIELAETGYKVSDSMTYWLAFRRTESSEWPGFSELFAPKGVQLVPGDIFKQPTLAQSLRSLATDGAQSFYEGALSQRILDGLGDAGVKMVADDLKRTNTRTVDPISLEYRGVQLLAPPPPTQGLTTLQIMGILARFDFSQIREGSCEHFHLVIEAVKQAFLVRGEIADPEYCKNIANTMLDDAWLDDRQIG